MSDPQTGSSESVSSTAETPCGELICQRFGWPKEQFLEKAFWRCLPKFAVPFAAILWPWRTRVFARDFEALRDVAAATTTLEINFAANSLRHDPRFNPSFIRDSLGIRVSGRRLNALVQSVRSKSTGVRRSEVGSYNLSR